MTDFVALENLQTGTLQLMAIDRELFSTSLYGCAFVIVTIDDGQTSKKTRTWASGLRRYRQMHEAGAGCQDCLLQRASGTIQSFIQTKTRQNHLGSKVTLIEWAWNGWRLMTIARFM